MWVKLTLMRFLMVCFQCLKMTLMLINEKTRISKKNPNDVYKCFETVENGETEAAQRSIDVSDSVSYDVMEATTLFSRHPGSTRTIGLAWKEMKSYITFRHVTDVQI